MRGTQVLQSVLLGLALVTFCDRECRAQDSLRVVPGWGVDTSSSGGGDYVSQGPVPEIYRAWSTYLRTDATRQAPTKFWSAAEQRRWARYDIAGSFAYQGFPATVLSIQLARSGAMDEYVVRTLFASVNGPSKDIKPIALTRVYAVRESGRWVFANALPYLTHDWSRHNVGHITYIVQPGHRFDQQKARNAARFADSTAAMFGVSPLPKLEYYVTDTPEEIHRILGLDFLVGGAQQSYFDPVRRMVLVGSPVFAENHRHELTHFALLPFIVAGRMPGIINEGTATWLGGSLGKSYPGVMREYAAFLSAHPSIMLDSVLTEAEHDLGIRPAGAALVEMTYQLGGVGAVKTLMRGGHSNDELRSTLTKVFGKPWPEIQAEWRAHILEYGSRSSEPPPNMRR